MFRNLTQTQIRSRLSAAIWGLTAIGFFAVFFHGGGSSGFGEDSNRHLYSAIAVAFGYVANGALLWFTRGGGSAKRIVDERDDWVLARAGQTTLIAILIIVYVASIGLWTAFEQEGSVPVGWMWFLAYGTVIIGSLTYAVATIVIEQTSRSYG